MEEPLELLDSLTPHNVRAPLSLPKASTATVASTHAEGTITHTAGNENAFCFDESASAVASTIHVLNSSTLWGNRFTRKTLSWRLKGTGEGFLALDNRWKLPLALGSRSSPARPESLFRSMRERLSLSAREIERESSISLVFTRMYFCTTTNGQVGGTAQFQIVAT